MTFEFEQVDQSSTSAMGSLVAPAGQLAVSAVGADVSGRVHIPWLGR